MTNRKRTAAATAQLTAAIAAAREAEAKLVEAYEALADAGQDTSGLGALLNAASDNVAALEEWQRDAERAGRRQGIDPNTLALTAQNID